MDARFPEPGFFSELSARVAGDPVLPRLGVFDATFGLRVLSDGGGAGPLFVLAFDAFELRHVRRLEGEAPEDVDFVLEAPQAVWRDLFRDPKNHTINTLTHHGAPMRVIAPDPLGHDKLFRFQESIQRVFEIAAAIR